MNKFLCLIPLGFLSGCAMSEWIIGNADTLEKGAAAAGGLGGYGALAGAGVATIISIAKWMEHKSSAKDVISAIQSAKAGLPDASKKILSEGLDKYMPSKVKKYVSKVKKIL